MSIFISNLAFANNSALITGSKISILLASVISALVGLVVLTTKNKDPDTRPGAKHRATIADV
jgi:Na+/H+ antiporter NhaA